MIFVWRSAHKFEFHLESIWFTELQPICHLTLLQIFLPIGNISIWLRCCPVSETSQKFLFHIYFPLTKWRLYTERPFSTSGGFIIQRHTGINRRDSFGKSKSTFTINSFKIHHSDTGRSSPSTFSLLLLFHSNGIRF